MSHPDILFRLTETIEARKQSDPHASYVAKLLHDGRDKILKKIAEESAEVLLASKDGDSAHVVRETADLWFHCLVLLAHHNLKLEDVLGELRRREGVSGIDEKAARKAGQADNGTGRMNQDK
ncbi:phosphoribosyl-ATP pyrophosphatase [Nitrosospira multiformis]|uniref:Phosphoribosyl-ATP pyrophosphatase n=1 Tax=Nitrosospira multiformis TaxID=1231 RepID=A0A1I0DJG1_9PROT|nr:phosphoribosyl-ATP diphosphatase [Nitrosospira multiformis]SET32207.1 phosphoribosyl-ATP pyrophosphatase [Nitrosospira multiformis]